MTSIPQLKIIQDGPNSGVYNMESDQAALNDMVAGQSQQPRLRFFEWIEPTISYGYLMDDKAVAEWAKEFPSCPKVKRPTGGGTVYHKTTDLSFSLLWPRGQFLPEKPRDCYEAIHKILKKSLEKTELPIKLDLRLPQDKNCALDDVVADTSKKKSHFSVCFQEPVCNDVMVESKKVLGGALRLSRNAILYQGALQLEGFTKKPFFIDNVVNQFLTIF